MVFKVLFGINAYYNLNINQIDLKTTFLYNLIHWLVYVLILKASKYSAKEQIYARNFKSSTV